MKQTIELNAKDIERLIAKEFNVKEEQVIVSLSKVYSGYGIGENKDYTICALINMGESYDRNNKLCI